MTAKEAASTSSATEIPKAAIRPPASAAPNTEAAAKPRFISALPSLMRSRGFSSTPTAPRVSPRPVIASVPSRRPRARTSGKKNRSPSARKASAAKASASIAYSAGSVLRSEKRSRCAVSPVASSAGRNFATRKNPAVGATDSVRSYTRIERATTPMESPRSLIVYEPSRRPNGRTRRGSSRLRTAHKNNFRVLTAL